MYLLCKPAIDIIVNLGDDKARVNRDGGALIVTNLSVGSHDEAGKHGSRLGVSQDVGLRKDRYRTGKEVGEKEGWTVTLPLDEKVSQIVFSPPPRCNIASSTNFPLLIVVSIVIVV